MNFRAAWRRWRAAHLSGYRLFNFGRNNRLRLTRLVEESPDGYMQTAWWLNGRIFGRYVSSAWKTFRNAPMREIEYSEEQSA